MTTPVHFRATHLRCQCDRPHVLGEHSLLHGLHLHGALELRLDGTPSEFPSEDVCTNGFAAALAQVRDHVLFGTRKPDPTTYLLQGPPAWPVLEFLRMHDLLRVAALVDGEGISAVLPVGDFQPCADRFLQECLAAVDSHRHSNRPVSAAAFFEARCNVFRVARAAQVAPVWLQSAADPNRKPSAEASMVICARVAEMSAAHVAGSIQGHCFHCGAPVWISPTSRVLIEEQSNPICCVQCASSHRELPPAPEVSADARASIDQLRAQAERAYEGVQELRDEREIRWRCELAVDSLRSAGRIAREFELVEEALALERRADHIHSVCGRRLRQPPNQA